MSYYTTTSTPNLYKNPKGVFYARWQSGGTQKYINLKTRNLKEAKSKLQGALDSVTRSVDLKAGDTPSVEDALQGALEEIQSDLDLAKSTKEKYYPRALALVLRHLPRAIRTKSIADFKSLDYQGWWTRHRLTISLSYTAGCRPIWNRAFDRAIELSQLPARPRLKYNAAKGKAKLTRERREKPLPTKEEFGLILDSIREQDKVFSVSAALFVELVGYTGLRKGEAQGLRWQDVDWERKELRIERSTKGCDPYTQVIPLNPLALDCLRRIKEEGLTRRARKAPRVRWTVTKAGVKTPCRKYDEEEDAHASLKPGETVKKAVTAARHDTVLTGPNGLKGSDFILAVTSPGQALHGACERLGVPDCRIHDLRHYFATRSVQDNGVSPSTVASWLGHKDGGVLIASRYNHVCTEHSKEEAANWS